MTRYFVKTFFHGWQEVDKEHFYKFVQHKIKESTGIREENKDAFIKTVTKIIEE